MNEILRSLAISSGVLLPVVILAIIASIAAVRRGEAAAHGVELAHEGGHAEVDVAPSKSALARFIPERDPYVIEILVLAVVLFSLTMGLLLGFSILQQLL